MLFSLRPFKKHEAFKLLVHIHEWKLIDHETNSPLTANNLSPSQEIPRIARNKNTYLVLHYLPKLATMQTRANFIQFFKIIFITLHLTLRLRILKNTSLAGSVTPK